MESIAEMGSGGEGEQESQEVSQKSLLQNDALYEYILETSVYPREPEPLKELRLLTAQHPLGYMAISVDGGQFLNMLLKLINAKKTMEIGVFTGYSLLATALALPHDGKILAMDVNKENYELGLPIIEKAGVGHKIDFREGPALPFLDLLLQDETNYASFDFAFVDADKGNYINYHKRIIELVKIGGVIGYDNTLWNGSVVSPPDAPMEDFVRFCRDFVMEFNKATGEDPRIEICMLPVGSMESPSAVGLNEKTNRSTISNFSSAFADDGFEEEIKPIIKNCYFLATHHHSIYMLVMNAISYSRCHVT